MRRLALSPLLALTLALALGCPSQDPPPPAREDAPAPAAGGATSRPAPGSSEEALAFARALEDAHGGRARWDATRAVHAGIAVRFGGKEVLRGTIRFTPEVGRARLEAGETTVVFDGETCWVSPPTSELQRPRFHVLTWAYFLAAPFKLRDPGARLALEAPAALAQDLQPGPVAKLTFAPGTGDAPEDWYRVYRDPEGGRLRGMAYIVTYGKTAAQAGEPHAIRYHDEQQVAGLTLSTRWTFHHWSPEQGIHGEPIGEATLTDLHVGPALADAFRKPGDDARRVDVPAPK